MTKELKVFKSEEFGSVRVVEINNEPWFVAKDISDFLNYNRRTLQNEKGLKCKGYSRHIRSM